MDNILGERIEVECQKVYGLSKEKMPKNFYVQYRGRSGKGKLGRLRNSKWFTLGEAIEFAKEKQDGYTISNIVRASVNPLKSNNHEHHLYGYIDKKKDLILEREGIPFSIYRCSNCSARNFFARPIVTASRSWIPSPSLAEQGTIAILFVKSVI